MVSQYMAGQKGAGIRISWSWKKTFGIAIKAAWGVFKRKWEGPKRGLVRRWETFLRDGTVDLVSVMANIGEWAKNSSWHEMLRDPIRSARGPVGIPSVCVTRFQISGVWYEASSATNFVWQPLEGGA
jgi:hypothetical protein